MVFTCLEAARLHVVHDIMYQSLSSGMDSIFADYYLPLYEEYGIFARYLEESDREDGRVRVESELKECMQYQINPKYGLEGMDIEGHNLAQAHIEQMDVTDLEFLTDLGNNSLYTQAIECAKYVGAKELLQTVLAQIKGIKDEKKTVKIYEIQSKTQEQLVKIDEIVIQLMELLDGLQFKKGQLQLDKKGEPKVSHKFGKQLIEFPISQTSAEINRDEILQALMPYYRDRNSYGNCIIELLDQMQETVTTMETRRKERLEVAHAMAGLEEQQNAIAREISRIESENVNNGQQIDQIIFSGEERSQIYLNVLDSLQNQMSELSEKLRECSDRIKEIDSIIDQCEERLREEKSLINTKLVEASMECNEILNCMEQASSILGDGILLKQDGKNSIDEYETYLRQNGTELEEVTKAYFDEELISMKQYVEDSGTHKNYRFKEMLSTIEQDIPLLIGAAGIFGNIHMNEDYSNLQYIRNQVVEAAELLKKYSIKDLQFDYSSFSFQVQEASILDIIKSYGDSKLCSLILAPDSLISDQKLHHIMEYQSTGSNEKSQTQYKLSEFIDDPSKMSEKNDFLSMGVSSFGGDTVWELLSEQIIYPLLFGSYIETYFKGYLPTDSKVETTRYPSVLSYEKEFICFGNLSDKRNLEEIVERVFLIRFLLQIISVCCDKNCRIKAEETAILALGFTGLPMLVTAMKILILFAWAFEEAIVDAAIIFRGGQLDWLQKKRHFSYQELLSFNQSIISKKVEGYKTETKLRCNYDTYLFFFLLLESKEKKEERILNIIEYNLNYRYDTSFQIRNCMTSMRSTVTYSCPGLFRGKLKSHYKGFTKCKGISYS